MRTFTRGAVPLVALAMLVATSLPSSAAKPTTELHVNEGWFTLPDITCDGFTLSEEMVSETIRITTFTDRHGTETEMVMKAIFEGVITHSETGETFRDLSVFRESAGLLDGTVTVSGPSFHYIRTGHGQVYAEVGHKILLEDGTIGFQAGQDDFSEQDLDGLCDALG